MKFHFFPKLPPELRLEIWRLCLPHRVYELDNPFNEVVYIQLPYFPCTLQDASYINGREPDIARVCREARAVAYESGHIFEPKRDDSVTWAASTSLYQWLDPARDAVHLNWTPPYRADFNSAGNHPLRFLALVASVTAGGSASFMLDQLTSARSSDTPPLVVVLVVVIHADRKTGAESGLFGLLGDAPVQIVEVADQARIDAYFALVDACRANDAYPQEATRALAESAPPQVRGSVAGLFESQGPPSVLVPAIMFRFCMGRDCRPGSRLLESWEARQERKKSNPSPPPVFD
ncbi:hypothetical protein BDW72DRAFT_211287 [Aspergillus terricola var. indicus]